MQAVDDYTIELHTGDLHFDMLLWMSVPYAGNIVSKKQVDELGDEAASANGAGTGPWRWPRSGRRNSGRCGQCRTIGGKLPTLRS